MQQYWSGQGARANPQPGWERTARGRDPDTRGIAQIGLALLVRQPLARWMRRPVAWAAVATANLSAMTLFLWHQTALLAVTLAGLAAGWLPGLHTPPSSAAWVAERVAWLPVFAVALAVLWLEFQRAERPAPPAVGCPPAWNRGGRVPPAISWAVPRKTVLPRARGLPPGRCCRR